MIISLQCLLRELGREGHTSTYSHTTHGGPPTEWPAPARDSASSGKLLPRPKRLGWPTGILGMRLPPEATRMARRHGAGGPSESLWDGSGPAEGRTRSSEPDEARPVAAHHCRCDGS
jgi:hypothetical protein